MQDKYRGFTIVELLVGMFIGLMVASAIYGTAVSYEASRRHLTGGNSALENGIAGLSGMEHDGRMAGLGLIQNGGLLCASVNVFYKGTATANGATVLPVSITDGGSGSDQVTFMYSDASFGLAPVRLIENMPTASSIFKTNTSIGLSVGQLALVVPNTGADPCTLVGVTHLGATGFGATVQHNPGTSEWNPPNPAAVFTSAPAYQRESMILGMGSFVRNTWRVANNNLEVFDHNTNTAVAVAENIVAFQARYGISEAPGFTNISDWVDATGTWEVLDGTSMRRVRAIQVGVLARSKVKDKPQADGVCNTTTVAPAIWPNGPSPDLSADPDWRCYRYKPVHSIIPLKNIIYGGIS